MARLQGIVATNSTDNIYIEAGGISDSGPGGDLGVSSAARSDAS